MDAFCAYIVASEVTDTAFKVITVRMTVIRVRKVYNGRLGLRTRAISLASWCSYWVSQPEISYSHRSRHMRIEQQHWKVPEE